MKYTAAPLEGAFLIDLEPKGDERGFFARFFCEREFEKMGLETHFVNINNSLSVSKGTLRGMHYQLAPKSETKVVRCIRGAIYDVILDLRPDSPTFGQHFGAELSESNRRVMYVPKGFGHGFVSLEDYTEILYLVSEYYSPEHERGIRWNDPTFNIQWPFLPTVISDKDGKHANFDPNTHLCMPTSCSA